MKIEFALGIFDFRPELMGEIMVGRCFYPTQDEIEKSCVEIRSKWTDAKNKNICNWTVPIYNSLDIE